MKLCDINPHIRYASQIHYVSSSNPVTVRDCRLFYIISGSGEIVIENQHYIIEDNCLFYCPSGSRYNITSEQGLSLLSLNFDLTQNNNNITEPYTPIHDNKNIKINTCNVDDSDLLNSHLFIKDAAEFYSKIRKIVYEFTTQRIHFRELSGALLKELLLDIHRTELEQKGNASDAVSYVINYINSNFAKEIKNCELATLAGYHEYHLNRLFIRHTGMSMHNYIISMRINEAKKLILNTDLPLNIIAENVGFKSYTHFSSYFKKTFSRSPLEYKRKFKNKI